MIIVLCEETDKGIADAITQDIAKQYDQQLNISVQLAERVNHWPGEHSWDDLLIVIYSKAEYPKSGKSFIHEYREFDKNGFILPIAARYESNKVPPEPITDIKAIIYNDQALKGITRRVGAIMGLRLRHDDSKIFISYHTTDGSEIAQELNNFLQFHGFQTWLDKAKDPDGEEPIQAGENVQDVIEKNLKEANLILLIDTPDATKSRWIQKEIDIALSEGIPVYPVYIRLTGDRHRKPRFNALANLSRWFPIDTDLMAPLS